MRSVLLLIALVFLLLLYPFLETFLVVRGLLDLAFTLVLLGALYSATKDRLTFRLVSSLTILALGGRWLPYAFPVVSSPFFRYGPSAAVFTVAAGMLLVKTLRSDRVTFDQIAGALSVFLLLGLVWAHAYFLLEAMRPGSLALGIGDGATEQARFGASVYFSYVTLTTLGYGDIAPVSGPARSLSMTEAIVGQFYVAVLIARLVGIQVARQSVGDR